LLELSLLRKYNEAGPRYTSYPSVPHWKEGLNMLHWTGHVQQSFAASNDAKGISLYIHLPFCESLCTYCGCNTRITVNHKVEEPYIKNVLKEWEIYRRIFAKTPEIREIHLGGGTPTFFSPKNLKMLLEGILENCILKDSASLSFEAHPANTTKEHLSTLYDLGFRRLSLGIQDFNPEVQLIINRIQTYEQVETVCNNARAIGYNSINFDLIYGLPLQSVESIKLTIIKAIELKPERIAFYGYAHVPWIKPGQRKYSDKDIPDAELRLKLYAQGKVLLEGVGYSEIGMDHFALENDELLIAQQNGSLHRNFMGYTPFATDLLIGLGVSSISESGSAFSQNVKTVEAYNDIISKGTLPLFKGHVLSKSDLQMREIILDLMCRFQSDIPKSLYSRETLEQRLGEMISEGLLSLIENHISVSEKGKSFIRNICMRLDPYMEHNDNEKPVFSKTI